MSDYLLHELKNIIYSYIGYRVEYDNGNVENRSGRILDYDKKRRKELKRITGYFDYFIDEKELFKDCEKLIELPSSVVVRVTDCGKMFYRSGCVVGLENWDVSNVTDMFAMFCYSECVMGMLVDGMCQMLLICMQCLVKVNSIEILVDGMYRVLSICVTCLVKVNSMAILVDGMYQMLLI